MNAIVAAGYPYELVGLFYYVFFLMMGRKRFAGIYSLRTRIATLLAAIAMVACVPLGYANNLIGVIAMAVLALFALVSSAIDANRARRK